MAGDASVSTAPVYSTPQRTPVYRIPEPVAVTSTASTPTYTTNPVQAPATLGTVAPPSPRATTLHDRRPTVRSHRPGRLRDAVQGQNTSVDAIAESGAVDVLNEVVVDAGPVNGQQFGDNRIRIDQDVRAESGAAVAGSQVVGSVGRGRFSDDRFFDDPFFGDPFFGDPFFRDHDDLFFDDPFFRHRNRFLHVDRFMSDARLTHLEILADMAEDCLDRLHDRFSRARLRICRNLVHRLAEETSFLDPFFGDVFFSRSGINAMIGWGGFAASSQGRSVLFGPLGVSVAGQDGATTFGFGGFATTAGGASSGGGPLLFAPFGTWWSPFDGGFHHRHQSPHFVSFWTVDDEIDHLEFMLALARERLHWLQHHRFIIGTIHAHSFFRDPWRHAPFGHGTVFISGRNTFVPHRFLDDDDIFDRDLFRSRHRSHRHLVRRHHHHRREPVLDLPGIDIGAGRFFV